MNGLAQDTYYYVRITQTGSADALYNIKVEKGSSEGYAAVPVALTYGANHAGAVSGSGSSYYTFTPTNTGDSIITLTTTSALTVNVYSDPAFSSGQMQWCPSTAGAVCTVSNVNQGVPYYLLVTNYATSSATYTVNVSAGSNEGSISQPIALTLSQTHSATIDGNTTSYYKFTTAESGSYTITMNTTLASTYWSLYLDQNYTQSITSSYLNSSNSTVGTNQCTGTCTTFYYMSGGKAYYNLDANTTYYLTVKNDSTVSGTFTLSGATGAGNSEGSVKDPVVITEGTAWSGRIGFDSNSYYAFTPSQSANYLIRVTNIADTTGTWGPWVYLYADAGFATSLGSCYSYNFKTSTGDMICSINNFTSPNVASLTAGTTYYIRIENSDDMTNTYSLTVSPYAPSFGCNSGGATCYNFESGIPAGIIANAAAPQVSDSPWELATSSTGTGAWNFTSTEPNGNPASYYSCFSFSAADVKWIGYTMKITTTGTDSLYLYVRDSSNGYLPSPSLGSGNTAWQRRIYIPPQNAYTYEWCYDKRSAASGDAAWIDDIELN